MCKLVVGQHYSLYDRSSFGKTVCKLKLPTTSCEHANNNNNDNVLLALLLLILLLLLCIISLCGDEVRMCGLPQDQDDTTTKATIVKPPPPPLPLPPSFTVAQDCVQNFTGLFKV